MQLYDYAIILLLIIVILLAEIHSKLKEMTMEICLRAIMDPTLTLLTFPSCTLLFFFHFASFLLTYFLPLSSYFMYKGEQLAQENIFFCWIIFKDKKKENLRENFLCDLTRCGSFPFLNIYKKKKEKHVNVSRESTAMFTTLGERYDYDIRAATCWRKHKCLVMMEKSIFRRVTSWPHNFLRIRSDG